MNSSFLDSRYQLFEGRLALTRGQVFFQILVSLLFKRIFSEVFSSFLAELPMIKLQTKRIKLNIICKLPFLNYNFAHWPCARLYLELVNLITQDSDQHESLGFFGHCVHMSTNNLYTLVFTAYWVFFCGNLSSCISLCTIETFGFQD